MPPRARATLGFTLAIAGLLAAAVALQVASERAYAGGAVDDRFLYVQASPVVDRLALSYDALVADVYWIRAIQHYGGDRRSEARRTRYELLYPLLDLTTTLDPRFVIAYRFGAIFLSEPYPSGAGRPDLAITLLEKGLRAQPDKWQYWEDIGFIHYWQRGDMTAAAAAFEMGSRLPGAPWWLKSLAAVTLAQGGSRQASRFLWRQILDGARDPWLRDNAQMRLVQLDALDQLDHLRALVAQYEHHAGRRPASWDDLVRAGMLADIPKDPSGEPWVLKASTGEVEISGWSKLAPLPKEPPVRTDAAPGAGSR